MPDVKEINPKSKILHISCCEPPAASSNNVAGNMLQIPIVNTNPSKNTNPFKSVLNIDWSRNEHTIINGAKRKNTYDNCTKFKLIIPLS